MYSPDYGQLGTRLSKHLRLYNQELKDAPKMSSQITSKEWLASLEQHKQRVFDKYRRGAMLLKEDYLKTKNEIDKKRNNIFYPLSNSYDESKRHTALLERSLAIQQMQGGNLDKNAMLKMIDDDFANGGIDKNGERYQYLLTHNLNNLETQLAVISKLKEGFNKLGLPEIEETKRDVETASGEFEELQRTFGV